MKKTFDFQCFNCGWAAIEMVENPQEVLPCPKCEGEVDNEQGEVANTYERVWLVMPGITRATFIDSSKTARAAEFAGEKRAAQLDIQAGSVKKNSEEWTGLKKEAKELRKVKK